MKIVKYTAALSLIATCLFSNAQAATDSATINLSATVVDNTCTTEWSTAGVDVNMNRVSLQDFSDKVGASKNFTLSLKDCGADTTTVKVTATGTPDDQDNTLFSNTEAKGASGVGFSIWGGSTQATQMKPDGSGTAEYTITDGKADMVFLAKLMQTGTDTPGTGEVKSIVTMTVDYQ